MQVVSGRFGQEHIHFEAPSGDRVAFEMDRFLNWFNSGEALEPVLKSALAHLWFVTIHPFDDGNGRVARAIADLSLARSEEIPQRFYSMSAQIQRERASYYQQLETTQKGDLDVTQWLTWFLDCLSRALESADSTLESVIRKAQFWEKIAPVSINERQRVMLNRLYDGFDGKLTTTKWAKMTKTSQDTAQRDIADLIEHGFLSKDSSRGRSTSYSIVKP